MKHLFLPAAAFLLSFLLAGCGGVKDKDINKGKDRPVPVRDENQDRGAKAPAKEKEKNPPAKAEDKKKD